MSARRKPRDAAPMLTAYGVPYVAINTTSKRNFARACLITMTMRDGRDRGWMLRAMKSIDVPADVIEATRARLARERVSNSEDDRDE